MSGKIPKSMKGKYVSRAVFAKLQSENHRLKHDIYTMLMVDSIEAIRIRQKYRKEFRFWEQINAELKKIAKEELPKLKAKIDSNPKAFR